MSLGHLYNTLLCIGVSIVGCQEARAQECRGITGIVISQETFGTGAGGPLPTDQIPYQYVVDGCPNDGQYTLAKTVSGTCYTSSWHGVMEDHTPNEAGGNMLVVNVPYPSAFYKQTYSGLCNGTTYVFSMWLANLNIEMPPGTCGFPVPQDPDITIRAERLDGSLIDSGSTGVIRRTTNPLWRQFSFQYTIPGFTSDTSTVVIRLVDKESGGCGNDFVLDDLTLTQCSDCYGSSAYIPDVFTPNGDGVNDRLEVKTGKIGDVALTVFNRWGSVIFATTDLTNTWDGTFQGQPCPEDVYTWTLTYGGSGSSQHKLKRTGRILLIR